jgi:ring-1,2-phenylacetyl-CoA epoxidase subunit PaaE
VDDWFLCGPFGLVDTASGVLASRGVPSRTVHIELFSAEGAPTPPPAPAPALDGGATSLTFRLDGRESTVAMLPGERVLDAALRVRPGLPYACRGGVCATCRARLVSGEVTMVKNFALEPGDLSAGYVLTCQSQPASSDVSVDYDG